MHSSQETVWLTSCCSATLHVPCWGRGASSPCDAALTPMYRTTTTVPSHFPTGLSWTWNSRPQPWTMPGCQQQHLKTYIPEELMRKTSARHSSTRRQHSLSLHVTRSCLPCHGTREYSAPFLFPSCCLETLRHAERNLQSHSTIQGEDGVCCQP